MMRDNLTEKCVERDRGRVRRRNRDDESEKPREPLFSFE